MKTVIVGGPQTNDVDVKLAKELGLEHFRVEHKVFPDGESYVRYPLDISGKHVVIVQTTFPEQDKRLIELLLMVDAAKHLGAEKITVVVPYIAYARQDRMFREGEAVSIRAVLRMLEAAGADTIVTVNIHKRESLNYLTKARGVDVDAVPEIARYFLGKLENPLVLGPDKGALRLAEAAAKVLGADYDYLEKFRDRVTGEITVKPKKLAVEGRDVLIVDDIISTGGTIAKAAEAVRSQGAKRVFIGAVHGLFVGEAYKKIEAASPDDVVTTDTVINKFTKVTVARALAEAIKPLLTS